MSSCGLHTPAHIHLHTYTHTYICTHHPHPKESFLPLEESDMAISLVTKIFIVRGACFRMSTLLGIFHSLYTSVPSSLLCLRGDGESWDGVLLYSPCWHWTRQSFLSLPIAGITSVRNHTQPLHFFKTTSWSLLFMKTYRWSITKLWAPSWLYRFYLENWIPQITWIWDCILFGRWILCFYASRYSWFTKNL